MTDDPLKQTPACELDRDNRVMTREDEGERAVRESLRAEIEWQREEWQRLQHVLTKWSDANIALEADNERLRALLSELIDIEGPQPGTNEWANKVRRALENKP